MNEFVDFIKKNWVAICVTIGILIGFVTLAVVLALSVPDDGATNNGSAGSKGLRFEEISGGYAVYKGDCTSVNIVIPSTYNDLPVVAIGDSGFKGKYFTSITIPESVTHIGDNAFEECEDLDKITIPGSVKTIGKQAFLSSGLDEVVLINGLQNIGEEAFKYTSLDEITIPESVVSIGLRAFEMYSLEKYFVDEKNEKYEAVDGILYTKGGEHLVHCPKQITDGRFEIRDGVKYIDDYAFYNHTYLTYLVMPDTVLEIGEYAFATCTKLREVAFSKGLITIGTLAFLDCTELVTLEFGPNLQRIEDFAFKNSIYSTRRVLELPDGLKYIGDGAFGSCMLRYVSIPNTVTYIGDSAFTWFDRDIIEYRGTKAEWNRVQKGSKWWGWNPVTLECTDGSYGYR